VNTGGTRDNPDVAYNADPNTGVYVYDSGWWSFGGTSAGAPQWAGLFAVVAQLRAANGSLDGATQALPALYGLPSAAYHDITSGNNGAYAAGPGWDACSGLGSPDGTALMDRLQG